MQPLLESEGVKGKLETSSVIMLTSVCIMSQRWQNQGALCMSVNGQGQGMSSFCSSAHQTEELFSNRVILNQRVEWCSSTQGVWRSCKYIQSQASSYHSAVLSRAILALGHFLSNYSSTEMGEACSVPEAFFFHGKFALLPNKLIFLSLQTVRPIC